MTIRKNAIDKLKKLPDSLLPQVSDFIDFLIYRYQTPPTVDTHQNTVAEKWAQWFDAVDRLPMRPTESIGDYQQHLLAKYRKQGLEL
jgi:hypothetical protein